MITIIYINILFLLYINTYFKLKITDYIIYHFRYIKFMAYLRRCPLNKTSSIFNDTLLCIYISNEVVRTLRLLPE